MFSWNRPRKNNTHGFQLMKGMFEQLRLYLIIVMTKTAGKDQLTFRKSLDDGGKDH